MLESRRAVATLVMLCALTVPACPATAQPPDAGPPTAATDQGFVLSPRSRALALAPAAEIEQRAAAEYAGLLEQAAARQALASADSPQLKRLRGIADRLIPQAKRFNEQAQQWRWEVNLIGSGQINAFCLPGGKIAFYSGIIDRLELSDDEIAIVAGHEMAHALREHGRERVGKARLANGLTIGASVLSQLFGFGDLGGQLASGAARLTLLKFGREDEAEADLIGMELAARAGFDPRAGIVLWQKMAAASRNQAPQWLSTHPSHDSRIEEIRRNLGLALPLYARARGTTVAALPPYRSGSTEPTR